MKKLLAVLALALLASPAFAATIVNTAHDLSDNDSAAGNEVCVYCHTPHGASTSVTLAPLWNRTVTNATGSVYQGLQINGEKSLTAVNASDAPLCLSCHDGTVGETLQNEPNTGTTNVSAYSFVSTAANLGTDMTNDHPIGFNWTTVLAGDSEIRAKTAVETTLGAGAVSYGGDQMWCSSCHDVHNDTNRPFLRVSNSGSALCLACHIK